VIEQERVARLMHEAHREYHRLKVLRSEDFDKLSDFQRDQYLFVAQAVLNDLTPSPLFVEAR
jgi:hypothetical protein